VVLLVLAGIVAVGAVTGVIIDKLSDGEEAPKAIAPPPARRSISWHALKAVDLAALRVCKAPDLKAVWKGIDAAEGQHAVNSVVVGNRSATLCRVQGAPEVSLIAADGRRVTPAGVQAFPGNTVPIVLEPGSPLEVGKDARPGQASYSFEWVACSESRVIRKVILTFGPGRVAVPVPGLGPVIDPRSGRPACVEKGSLVGMNRLVGGPFAWPTLVAAITAPPTAPAGGDLRYRITLRNNGPDPVFLRPCPIIEQSLGSAGGDSPGSRLLIDCSVVGLIRPEEEVSLEMVLAVPRSFGEGEVNLYWQMEGDLNTLASVKIEAS
jgi:uncharacterized protein DUF4232